MFNIYLYFNFLNVANLYITTFWLISIQTPFNILNMILKPQGLCVFLFEKFHSMKDFFNTL